MGDVVPFAPLPPETDRKARFRARRERRGLAKREQRDDLTMDHADPGACGFGDSMVVDGPAVGP